MSDRELGEKIGNFGLYPASILMYLHDCDRNHQTVNSITLVLVYI